MWRIALGLLAGIVSGAVLAGLLELGGHWLFPPPPGLDVTDPSQLADVIDSIPMGAKIAVIVAWGIGSFVGGAVAVTIARVQWPAFGVGGVLLGGGLWTMFSIHHPIWMVALGVFALIAPAIAGGYLAMRWLQPRQSATA